MVGYVWKFGDNINTDDMMPQEAFRLPPQEQAKWIFRALRPGWVDHVKPGDIIVAGRNFGTGSSRPAARSFKILGIHAIFAESINGLFYRNSINYGLPVFNWPDILQHFKEGERVEVDIRAGTIRHLDSGSLLQTDPFPDLLIKIIEAGGMIELLQKDGCLDR